MMMMENKEFRELVGCFCHTYIHTDILGLREMMGQPDLPRTDACSK